MKNINSIKIEIFEWILTAEYATERGESEFLYSGLYRYLDTLVDNGTFSREEAESLFDEAFLWEKAQYGDEPVIVRNEKRYASDDVPF